MTTLSTTKILQEFLDSNIKIKSTDKLNEYIKFCIYNNQNNKTKFKTSHHHILPNKLFSKYKNLNQNKWNGVHLLHKDHYYAHWLLTEAIDNLSMLNAFCLMHHNSSTKIANSSQIQNKIETKNLLQSKRMQELSYKEGVGKLISEKRIKTFREKSLINYGLFDVYRNNQKIFTDMYLQDLRKMSSLLQKTTATTPIGYTKKSKVMLNNNKSLNLVGLYVICKKVEIVILTKEQKRLQTISSQEWKNTIGKEKVTKRLKTISLQEWKNTIGKVKVAKSLKTIRQKTLEKHGLFDVYRNDTKLYNCLSLTDIYLINKTLAQTTKNKPLGFNNRSKSNLNKNNNLHLTGLYIVNVINKDI